MLKKKCRQRRQGKIKHIISFHLSTIYYVLSMVIVYKQFVKTLRTIPECQYNYCSFPNEEVEAGSFWETYIKQDTELVSKSILIWTKIGLKALLPKSPPSWKKGAGTECNVFSGIVGTHPIKEVEQFRSASLHSKPWRQKSKRPFLKFNRVHLFIYFKRCGLLSTR